MTDNPDNRRRGDSSGAAIKVRCPACGKSSRFTATDAGMVALCTACGARMIVRGEAGDPGAPDATKAATASGEPTARAARISVPAPPESKPVVTGPDPVRLYFAALFVAVCAALVIVAIALRWAPDARSALREQNRQAAGDVRERPATDRASDPYVTVTVPAVTLPPDRRPVTAPAPPASAPLVLAPAPAPVTSHHVTSQPVARTPTEKSPAATIPSPATQVAQVEPTPASRPSPAYARARLPIRPRLATAPAEANDALTDEAIGRSIQRAVTHLLGRFRNGVLQGSAWGTGELGGIGGGGGRVDAYATGENALCVYALLQAGLATRDERLNLKGPLVREMVDKMKAMPAERGPVTYARGIRATALALLGRPEDKAALAADVNYLLWSHVGGAYTYARPVNLPRGRAISAGSWDNSNSQYGLLGVWSAAEVGAEVNADYWQAVENHWARTQLANGAWDYAGYERGGSTGRLSMTAAGVASLFVTHDYLDARKMGTSVGREPFSKPLAAGLAYLEFGDNAMNVDGGYTLYGLERVGLASGFKFFGRHDWYRELAARAIRRQHADGSWGTDVETAFHLLFLARGRHPILMNKLRYDGPWANRPRDLANLARFGSRELERPLNWQVVPVDRDWTDWADAPILYVSTHKNVALDDVAVAKIRAYVEAGGMLFTQADGARGEASVWAAALARRLFPAYELADLPPDHALFGILFKPADRPPLKYVTNGSRILMLHSPTDVTQHWQMRADRTRRGLFELGVNLFLYATGKADPRNRLASPLIPAPATPPGGGRLALARVRYAGNWDPEPAAWPRFARYFQRETDVALDVAATQLAHLNPHVAPVAHWTGTAAYTPTDAEIAAVRRYVTEGGVLLVEPTGGGGEFYESARAALGKAFPDGRPQMIGKSHPMLTASGPAMDDLSKPIVRPYVITRGFNTSGRIDATAAGRGRVILSPLDLTTGLLGCNTWGVLGFDPAYSLKLMKNLILWSASGMPEDR